MRQGRLLLLLFFGGFVQTLRGRIEHTLHRIYLDGLEAFQHQTSYATDWLDWCGAIHPHWKHVFWDEAAANKLVADKFPWFEETWLSYRHRVERGDALRPMILYEYGGLYLDLDIQCLQPVDNFLKGHDIVLQGSDWRHEMVHQAAIASRKKETFLIDMLKLMVERQQEQPRFSARSFESVIHRTGPGVLNDLLVTTLRVDAVLPEAAPGVDGSTSYRINGTRIMVYDHSHWFVRLDGPGPSNMGKKLHLEKLQQGTLPVHYAGFHHGKGAWIAEQTGANS